MKSESHHATSLPRYVVADSGVYGCGMEPDQGGEYVRYEDVVALLAASETAPTSCKSVLVDSPIVGPMKWCETHGYYFGKDQECPLSTPSATVTSEWIPVAEGQLPRDAHGDEVLVWTITGHCLLSTPARIRALHADARRNAEDCFYTNWRETPKGPQ